MKLFSLFIVMFAAVITISSCETNDSSNTKTKEPTTKHIVIDTSARDSVLKWLAPGNYIADVINGVSKNPLLEKYDSILMKSVEDNQDWFLEYTNSISTNGGPLPYHPNLGLTQQEYNSYLNLLDSVVPVSQGQESIQIKENTREIHFVGSGFAKGIRHLVYNKEENAFYLEMPGISRSPALTLADTNDVEIELPNHPLGVGWSGYTWRYTEGDIGSDGLVDNPNEATYSIFELKIGKTSKKDVYFNFRASIVGDGESKASNQLPLLFR